MQLFLQDVEDDYQPSACLLSSIIFKFNENYFYQSNFSLLNVWHFIRNNDLSKLTDINMSLHNLTTLVEVLNELKKQGYKSDFFVEGTQLRSSISDNMYDPKDVSISDTYRFEGESNPDDSAILYAIETNTGEKGTIANTYGAQFDEQIEEYIKKVEKS